MTEKAFSKASALKRREIWILSLVNKEALSQKDVGDALGINRNTMVVLVDGLEKKGLIQRVRNPSNRKEYTLRVSDKGRVVVRDFEERREGLLAEAMAPLNKTESNALFELLRKYISL